MKKRIRCIVGEGLVPSEMVAKIRRADGGLEEVAVSGALVVDGSVDVVEIGRQGNAVLIELPVESAAGNWRVWVTRDELLEEQAVR